MPLTWQSALPEQELDLSWSQFHCLKNWDSNNTHISGLLQKMKWNDSFKYLAQLPKCQLGLLAVVV